MAKKVAKKKSAKKTAVVEISCEKPWHEMIEIEPAKKAELQWLHAQLSRCGVRSIGDLENLIARAE